VAWVCLIVVVALAVGLTLQIATQTMVTRADGTDLTQHLDTHTRGACTPLDEYVNRTMTIDELRDLRDQLCPDVS
jgi:hypothetical protein